MIFFFQPSDLASEAAAASADDADCAMAAWSIRTGAALMTAVAENGVNPSGSLTGVGLPFGAFRRMVGAKARAADQPLGVKQSIVSHQTARHRSKQLTSRSFPLLSSLGVCGSRVVGTMFFSCIR